MRTSIRSRSGSLGATDPTANVADVQEINEVLTRHAPCAWLPAGGIAEVVRSHRMPAPDPTVMVRLLVTCGGLILAVERDDGRGLDIPSAVVRTDLTSDLHNLVASVLKTDQRPALVGFVRNTVTVPNDEYPWPVPNAHFAVWHCDVERFDHKQGAWLGAVKARRELGERHWWPLAEALNVSEPVPDAIGHSRGNPPDQQSV